MHRRPVRASIFASVMALLLVAPTAAQDIGQFVVTDEPSGASVALHAAATPQSQVDPSTGIEIRFYLAQTGEIASILSVFEISDATGGYDIDRGVQGSAQGSGGTLLSCTPGIQQGFPARDFMAAVNDPSGASGTIQSRIIYTGQHVVQVQALGADARTAEVQQVFDQLLRTLDVPPAPVATGLPPASMAPGASAPLASVPTACFLAAPSVAPAP